MLQKFTFFIAFSDTDLWKEPVNGRHFHALLFQLISSINPALAGELHRLAEKPFSLWVTTQPGKQISFQLSVLNQRLAKSLLDLAASGPQKQYIGKFPVEVLCKPEKPQSVQELYTNFSGLNIERVKISFLTPTSFRRNGEQFLFPEPSLVLRSIYTKALMIDDGFLQSNIAHPDEYSGKVRVSRYNLETIELNYGRYKIIGFTGYALYDSQLLTVPYMRSSLAFLAAICQYTGIGYKTTMGMGKAEAHILR